MSYSRFGFTLIELLVVVAIIGILASVVLVSITGVRNSAKDARVKQQLNSLATQMDTYRALYGSYGVNANDDDSGSCRGANSVMDGTAFKDAKVMVITTKIMQDMNNVFRPYCAVRNGTWAFSAPIYDQSAATGNLEVGWCVDSSGARRQVVFDMSNMGAPLINGAVAECP